MTEYNKNTQNLISELETSLNKKIDIEISDNASDVFDPEDSQTLIKQDGNYIIKVNNKNFVDFSIVHELLHLKEYTNSIRFSLAMPLKDPQVSDLIKEMGRFLGNTVMHSLLVTKFNEYGILSDELKKAIVANTLKSLPAEAPSDNNPFLTLSRVMQLIDTIIFIDNDKKLVAELQEAYPIAVQKALTFVDIILNSKKETNRNLRGVVVKIFDEFTKYYQMDMHLNLPSLVSTIVLTPVLTERQLNNQNVKQHFQLWNDDSIFVLKKEIRDFVGLNNIDQQASFVISLDEKQIDSEKMLSIYNQPLGEFLNENKIYFVDRDAKPLD